MHVVAHSDWVIDIGPGAGAEGGRIVACGTPMQVAREQRSRTAPYLAEALGTAPARDQQRAQSNIAASALVSTE